MRCLASRNDEGTLSILLINYMVQGKLEAVTQFRFNNAPAGVYRMNVYRIDSSTTANMKSAVESTPVLKLPPVESRIVYVHSDFHFDVFTPDDSVILVQFTPECR